MCCWLWNSLAADSDLRQVRFSAASMGWQCRPARFQRQVVVFALPVLRPVRESRRLEA
jgi:hypothetical protein